MLANGVFCLLFRPDSIIQDIVYKILPSVEAGKHTFVFVDELPVLMSAMTFFYPTGFVIEEAACFWLPVYECMGVAASVSELLRSANRNFYSIFMHIQNFKYGYS